MYSEYIQMTNQNWRIRPPWTALQIEIIIVGGAWKLLLSLSLSCSSERQLVFELVEITLLPDACCRNYLILNHTHGSMESIEK